MVGDELEDARARGRELLLGGPAVGRAGDLAGLDLLAQAGDADLEELVEVAGEDGQELDPLEQRVALVARLVQDPRVELEPRQLAVEVRERGLRRAAARRGRAAATGRAGRAGAPGSIAAIGRVSGPLRRGRRRAAARPARIARPPIVSSSATYRRSPFAGSSQTRIVWPEVGSMKTSSLRRNRGSSGVAERLAAGAARRRAVAVGRLGAVADALDERRRR